MSNQFLAYAVISTMAWIAALWLVGFRRAAKPAYLAGWYLGIVWVTYVLKPLGTEWVQDRYLYFLLDLAPFEGYWLSMTVAVTLAFLSFALGYHRAGRGEKRRRNSRSRSSDAPPSESTAIAGLVAFPGSRRSAWRVGVLLVAWGYLALLIVGSPGGTFTQYSGNDPTTGYGMAVGSTFWFLSSDQFVSAGSLLLYLLTRNFSVNLLALPWFYARLLAGHGRTVIISHLFCVFLLAQLLRAGTLRRHLYRLLGLSAIAIVVLVVFPTLGQDRRFFQGDLSGNTLKDALSVATEATTSARDSPWLRTDSDICGFEETLYFIQKEPPAVWGTYYIYYYFIKPVPRMLWKNKGFPDTLAHEWFGINVDRRMFGLAMGAIGTPLQQWGWFGIPFEFALTGFLFRRFEGWLTDPHAGVLKVYAYVGLFALLPQLGRDSFLYMFSDKWLFQFGVPLLMLAALNRLMGVRRVKWQRAAA